jgi:hypothetical protein
MKGGRQVCKFFRMFLKERGALKRLFSQPPALCRPELSDLFIGEQSNQFSMNSFYSNNYHDSVKFFQQTCNAAERALKVEIAGDSTSITVRDKKVMCSIDLSLATSRRRQFNAMAISWNTFLPQVHNTKIKLD